MKVWVASAKLCVRDAFVMGAVTSLSLLASAVVIFISEMLTGAGAGWSEWIARGLIATVIFFLIGLAAGIIFFIIFVPLTRYEIWKNNQVLSRKERDEIERQKGEI